MELDDLKNIWQKEKEELESKIALNENLVREMSLDKSKNSFDKLIKAEIFGRNVAFFLMIGSIIIGTLFLFEFEYSIPFYLGAIAMMFSFFQHISSFQKPDLSNMSTLELQKAVCQFRIHTSKLSKYDISITIFWFLSMMPVNIRNISNSILPLFSTVTLFFTAVFILSTPIISKYIYKKQEQQLKEIEEQLKQIMEFEKN